ncbi:MAG TPA: PTS transporter subunit EIIC [Candidatus Baltobacteraceae bacterium]|nr:PTS transporter subunit EIIC [Candidatus Baltobacteraceae bacterium]
MSRSSAASRRSSAGSDPRVAPAGGGLVARLERAVAPAALRFAEAPAVRALQESLPTAFVAALVALIGLLAARPFHGWPQLARAVPGEIGNAFAIASLAMVARLGWALATRLQLPRVATLAASFGAFALSLPRAALGELARAVAAPGHGSFAEFAATLGASGIFAAIVVGLGTAACASVARARLGARAALLGLVAAVAIAAVPFAFGASMAAGLAAAIAPLGTLGDGFVALALIVAIETALWVVGIHGPALLAAIVLPVYLKLQAENASAFAQHAPIPHLVVTSTFLFVFPGGAGATLPLVALLLRSRVPRLRAFAYATIGPSLVGFNEPIMFGLPLAFNPVLALPFVAGPLLFACTTYAALALGWVARPLFYVPSSVPVFLNVFLATLDWRAVVLAAVNVALGLALWLPFVRIYERAETARAGAPDAALRAAS